MAAPMDEHGSDSGADNFTDSDAVPPDLDVLSPNFDPLKALYSSSVVLPVPGVQCFNNLGEYESFVSGRSRGRGRGQSEHAQRRRRKKELKEQAAGLIDTTKYNVQMRNVLSRMSEQTDGPHSLLYKCVQKRIKVRVCVRSFKGLRGICTGYLVAFDRDMNMALSDVDEVYRIPSTGQRFFHEEKLTFCKIMEYSKVRPKDLQRKDRTESSKGNQKAMAKYLKGRGSQGVTSKTQVCDDESTEQSTQGKGKRTEPETSREEDKRASERRKEGSAKADGKKQDDDKELELKVEKLKEGLAKLSSTDSQSAFTQTKKHEETASGSKSSISQRTKTQQSSALKSDKAAKSKTSDGNEDHLLKPMAFESQLLKSRTKESSASSEPKKQSERTTATAESSVKPGSRKGKQGGSKQGSSGGGKSSDSGNKNTGGGRILIRPEDFQRRHVNQLFLRGDNVVLVSVDKDLLESR